MQTTDRELLAQIAAGNTMAYAAFYDRHAPRIYGLILKLLRGASDAEDVLQDTFWQVWSKAAQYDPARGEPAAWVAMMARSRALDHLRACGRSPTADTTTFEPAVMETTGEDLDRATLHQRAVLALESLPADQVAAIRLAFFDGYTHEQIAVRLGEPLGTVKTRIRLGMRKLRDLVARPEVLT